MPGYYEKMKDEVNCGFGCFFCRDFSKMRLKNTQVEEMSICHYS